jgi:hypothetical protein
MGRAGEWLRRYGPAELLALVGAVAGYVAAEALTGSHAAAAFAAAAGDNLSYYGVMAVRETARRRSFRRAVRALALEFGPAEALDSTVVRPASTAIATGLLGPAGVLPGKLLADLAFYAPVIASYELAKRRRGLPDGIT